MKNSFDLAIATYTNKSFTLIGKDLSKFFPCFYENSKTAIVKGSYKYRPVLKRKAFVFPNYKLGQVEQVISDIQSGKIKPLTTAQIEENIQKAKAAKIAWKVEQERQELRDVGMTDSEINQYIKQREQVRKVRELRKAQKQNAVKTQTVQRKQAIEQMQPKTDFSELSKEELVKALQKLVG